MHFVVTDTEEELRAALGDSVRKVHYPNREGTAPICGTRTEGTLTAIRKTGKVTCQGCSGILQAERLWRKRGVCLRPARAAAVAA
jgi:hypothetical protein